MTKGKIAEACALFQESQRLDPTISTLMNEANCREKNGQIATAWGLFLEAERQTGNASNVNDAKLHKVAGERARKLESRVSKLAINVASEHRITGLEIVRGTTVLGEPSWNRALPVDGGTYKIVVRAPGMSTWSADVTIAAEGDTKTIDVPNLRDAAKQEEPKTAVAPPSETLGPGSVAPRSEPPPATPSAESPRSNTLPLVLGAVGGALIVGAIGLEISARSTYDNALDATDPETRESRWESANTKRYTAEGLALVGAGCVGVAVYLYVKNRGASKSSTAQSNLLLEPIIANSGAGIGVAGTY